MFYYIGNVYGFFELCRLTIWKWLGTFNFLIACDIFWKICQITNAQKLLNFMQNKKLSDLLKF